MITLNHNKEFITGSIKGKPYTVPFSAEAYEKLKTYKEKYDAATNPNSANAYVTTFSSAIKKLNENKVEEKKVVVGTHKFTIVFKEDGHPYLFNGTAYSKFWIPKEIHQRIEESESKEVDATPLYKFFARLLRNPVMTQEKAGRVSSYISKTWLDKEIYAQKTEQGLTHEEATKAATVYQVGITQEGLLVTYKASTLIGERGQMFEEEVEEFDEEEVDISEVTDIIDEANAEKKEEVDLSAFVFIPVRNKKGHFWKRGSDEYIQEYNKQLDAFKATLAPNVTPTETVSKTITSKKGGTKTITAVQEAKTKYAEDYSFLPAYQGYGGDSFYCGDQLGHIIQVGKRHYLPNWNQVDTNDSTTARPGLHVGGLDYIQSYLYGDNSRQVAHNIFVSPEHIGAVVSVENGDGAMRVKEYFVHSSFIGPNRGLYHSSTYAAETDAEWDARLAKALETVEQSAARIAEYEAKIAEEKKQTETAQAIVDNSF